MPQDTSVGVERPFAAGSADLDSAAALLESIRAGSEEIDALTDLFLSDEAVSAVPPAKAGASRPPALSPLDDHSSTPHVEALVLGHLPVLASAWVQQYARHVAAIDRCTVALLKVRAGETSLELIGSSGNAFEPTARPFVSFDHALDAACTAADRWLIRVDETSEPHLAEHAHVDAMTVLTGADEAAVVASYRALKGLCAHTGDEAAASRFRIAIMGANPEKASQAVAKLDRASAAFLGRSIPVSACVAKIGPGQSRSLYRSSASIDLDAALTRIGASPRPAHHHRAPASPRRGVDLDAPERVMPASPHISLPPPSPSPVTAQPTRPPPSLHRPAPARVSPTMSDEPSLATLVPLLKPLDIPCHVAPTVQLATDANDAPHLLASGPIGEALPSLIAAAAWLRTNFPLIARLAPTLHPSEPTLHLFTPDAAAARLLAESPIRLHLLARVQVGASSTWYSTPLN